MHTLCRFTFPLRWNVASSLKLKRDRRVTSSIFWSIRSQNLTRFRFSFGRRACTSCRRYGLNSKWRLNTCHTVEVFQVLCSLYGLTCVGYAQNSIEFVSRSPLIHVVGRSFCLYTDSPLRLVIPTTNALPRRSLNVETKTKRTLHGSRRLSFNELTNAKNLVLHSSHFALI